jgi:peroxiredoxin
MQRRIRLSADQILQRTMELAYVSALGLAVSASGAAGQQGKTDMKQAAQNKDAQAVAAPQPAGGNRPLEAQLEAMRAQFIQRADPATVARFDKGVEDVAALGLTESAKQAGDAAPAFELPDASGATVSLASLIAQGPVVVTFYRGGWCPYCNLQLRAYQERMDRFQELGATLVAISPEVPDETLSTKEKNELAFHVLSDKGNAVADAFGVRYRLPDDLVNAFKGRLELERLNGDDSWTLPLGATYVIGRDGTIAYAYLSADYRERAEPADVEAALVALAGQD